MEFDDLRRAETARAGQPAVETAPGWPAAAKSAVADWRENWRAVRGGNVDWGGEHCRFCRFLIL